MKKIYLLLLSFICLTAMSVYADSPCDSEMHTKQKAPCQRCKKYHKNYSASQTRTTRTCKTPCKTLPPQPEYSYEQTCDGFLCSAKDSNTLFKCMHLSETQICNAMKIQEKYEQEVLSLNERIQCENEKYYQLKSSCAKGSEVRKQKRLVKKLMKTKKDICKCYEKQFEATLSDMQRKAYRKAKK